MIPKAICDLADNLVNTSWRLLFWQIVVLNKTKERMLPYQNNQEEEDPDIKKIKKVRGLHHLGFCGGRCDWTWSALFPPQVQSFMRGWICRRKWKIIVQDYICSPHAESMRKRNQIVFTMVEAEAEYVHQLSILVNCFLRPLRMAASSKKPPISHDDVSSIFLNRCRQMMRLQKTKQEVIPDFLRDTVLPLHDVKHLNREISTCSVRRRLIQWTKFSEVTVCRTKMLPEVRRAH